MECKAIGVDFVQGYYVSRPQNVEQYFSEAITS